MRLLQPRFTFPCQPNSTSALPTRMLQTISGSEPMWPHRQFQSDIFRTLPLGNEARCLDAMSQRSETWPQVGINHGVRRDGSKLYAGCNDQELEETGKKVMYRAVRVHYDVDAI